LALRRIRGEISQLHLLSPWTGRWNFPLITCLIGRDKDQRLGW
jgi:hypothetical protein